ncbi:hypothetical protein [Variovorax gossypii]
MKIVVYNSSDQYALSRGEIELIKRMLPTAMWAGIREARGARRSCGRMGARVLNALASRPRKPA